MKGIRRGCVFAGSSAGARTEYARAAQELGAAIAARGYGLLGRTHRRVLFVADSPAAMLDAFEGYARPPLRPWISPESA